MIYMYYIIYKWIERVPVKFTEFTIVVELNINFLQVLNFFLSQIVYSQIQNYKN